MDILGIDGMSLQDLNRELQQGGRFVIYQFCISAVVLTFRSSSDIYFIRAGESAALKGLPYTLLSLLLGWWGFPWGPIYTLQALAANLQGGRDMTSEVVAHIYRAR